MFVCTQATGAFSEWKNVDANSTELEFFQGIQNSVEHVSGENYTQFTALKFKKQVVNGINYKIVY